MGRSKISKILFIASIALLICPVNLWAWPLESDWIAIYKDNAPYTDPPADINQTDQRDFVGGPGDPSIYTYNDGTNVYYRFQLNDDPGSYDNKGNLTGLKPFGWGILIDTDLDANDFEWLVMVDGIDESIHLGQNTVQQDIGSPGDQTEVNPEAWKIPLSPRVNFKVTPVGVGNAGYSNDEDYFLDFTIPYDWYRVQMGLTESSIIRFFFGSSQSTNSLTVDLSGTDLTSGLSNFTLPTGTQPNTGSICYINSDGTTFTGPFYPGETLTLEVIDPDQNALMSQAETVSVTVAVPSGDSIQIVLFETGVNTGIFRGSVQTVQLVGGDPSRLDVVPVETAMATYLDEIDANYDEYQPRIAQIEVRGSSDLVLGKKVVYTAQPLLPATTPDENDLITYLLTVTNNGPSDSTGIIVDDLLPTSGVTFLSDTAGGSYNPSTGVWFVGNLPNGASKTISINTQVKPGTIFQSFTNTASLRTPPVRDPDFSNNTASAVIAIQGTDLRITKTTSNVTPNNGDTVTFTLTVYNDGPTNATNVSVLDVLPPELIYDPTTFPPLGTTYNSSGIWQIGDLPSTTSLSFDLKAMISAVSGTLISNTAEIHTVDQADPVAGNNTDQVLLLVGGADLALSKSVNDSTPNAGDVISYTLTLQNTSSNPAGGVVVTDPLPPGLTFSGVMSINPGGSYSGGTWAVGTVLPLSTVTLTIEARVNNGTGGTTIINTASITSTDRPDPDPSDNSDSVSIRVEAADLSLTKAVDILSPNINDTIRFTLTLRNNGPDTATTGGTLQVSDLLPSTLTFTAPATASSGTYDNSTGIWDLAVSQLDPGQEETLIITATVNSGTALQTIRNEASILSSQNQEDPVPSNNRGTASLVVTGVDIAVEKYALPDPLPSPLPNPMPDLQVVNGCSVATPCYVNFYIQATNTSSYDATTVKVNDSLPTGLSFVSYQKDPLAGNFNSSNGEWSVGNIPAGQSRWLVIRALTTSSTTSTLVNTARYHSSTEADYDATNNADSASVLIEGADLSVSKTVSNETPLPGDTVTFSLTVHNAGPAAATNIVVRDWWPSGLSYGPDPPTPPAGTTYAYDPTYAVWVWDLGGMTLAGGASITFDISATVDSDRGGLTLTNAAQIYRSSQPDPNPSNDAASVSVTVQAADLVLSKSADDTTPNEGENIVYTLTVTNLGPHTSTGVTVTDLLPPEVVYLSDDSGGRYNSATGLWNVGNLAKTESAVLNITARTGSMTGGLTITNEASVPVGAGDPNSANNTASIDITPLHVLRPNITLVKTVSVVSDPVNGTTRPKALPGAVMLYTVTATNLGDGATDAGTVLIEDPIPSNTSYVPGSLTLTNNTGDPQNAPPLAPPGGVSYDDAFGTPCSACPTDDGTGVDPNVGGIKITLPGTLPASNGVTNPSFTIQFKVRIK